MPSLLLFLLSVSLFYSDVAFAACRTKRNTTPSTFDNITSAQWQSLNQSVNGKLQAGYPWAKPCYSFYNGSASPPNAAQCSAVQAGYANETVIASYFGGYQNANWGTCQSNAQGCNLNYSKPADASMYSPPAECYQGSVPSYYIEVISVTDVQAALAFANATKVPLIIKNTGHDYKGRSSAPNSLALWTHTYQPAIRLETTFTPEGCPTSSGVAVTVGAGQGFDGVYKFAEANNITIVGGSDRTVGAAGGWLSGGGHGALSNTLGLGVDNAFQIKAVLPNGSYVTTNKCQNQNLFYALRGGGGSTFAVNMEVTYRANPQVTLQVAYASFTPMSNSIPTDFMNISISNADKWATEGWGGYITPATSTGNTSSSSFLMMTPQLSLAEANASMSPILNFAASLGSATIESGIITVPSFYSAYQTFIASGTDKVGVGQALGSRLVPRSLFQSSSGQQQILSAMTQVTSTIANPGPYMSGGLQILVTTPASYPGDNSSSVTPAWRNSLWHAALGISFSNDADKETIQTAFKGAHAAADVLRQLAPNSGAYQNEADTFEPDPAAAFWGQANYERLSAIKREVDPGNILTCWDCIGLDESDPRYSCYPDIS